MSAMKSKMKHLLSAALAIVAAVAVGGRDGASAHSIAKSRQPAPDARLSAPPKEIRIEFGDGIEGEFSEISVTDQKGAAVASGKGADTCKGKVCTLNLPVLAPGTYTVNHSVLSRDGHVVKGKYDFTVTGNVP